MFIKLDKYCKDKNLTLVAVSKTKPISEIERIYNLGHRIFGENRVSEMAEKHELLPKDIQWHMIGHLQKNKVKYIVPFVSLIHSVDSIGLLETIHKKAFTHDRVIDVLLQLKIASEETKYGFNIDDLNDFLESKLHKELTHIRIRGLMGMASFTNDKSQLRKEFSTLKQYFSALQANQFKDESSFDTLSMGMSGDYEIAAEEGSNMVRIGSLIFGSR